MSAAMKAKLLAMLDASGVNYRLIEGEGMREAEVDAREGIKPRQGAKSILLIVAGPEPRYVLAVLPGDARIDHARLRKLLQSRDVKLADPDTVLRVTDCEIGSVPPFGELFGLPTFVDERLLDNEMLGMSAADVHSWLVMSAAEFRRVSQATVTQLAREQQLALASTISTARIGNFAQVADNTKGGCQRNYSHLPEKLGCRASDQ